ncbi:hypothetical protein [Amycolatopsis sp. NPDC059657]|uniref:hypothetical protein n=1 Tax=Amycolatopsis sp. NPDC059657 TaxID=3346899 RepID=UPI00366F4CDF
MSKVAHMVASLKSSRWAKFTAGDGQEMRNARRPVAQLGQAIVPSGRKSAASSNAQARTP